MKFVEELLKTGMVYSHSWLKNWRIKIEIGFLGLKIIQITFIIFLKRVVMLFVL